MLCVLTSRRTSIESSIRLWARCWSIYVCPETRRSILYPLASELEASAGFSLTRNEPCRQVRKRFAFCSLSRHSPYVSEKTFIRLRASSQRLQVFRQHAMSHADRFANASLFAHCRGIRRMCPKKPLSACERARSVCRFFRPRMAHC